MDAVLTCAASMRSVAILGAGDLGATLARRLAELELARRIVLVDPDDGRASRVRRILWIVAVVVAVGVLAARGGGPEAVLDVGQRGRETGKVRLLRQIAHGGAGLHEAAAAVGLHQARGDLEQRRFAGAVAADQADALARGYR